MTQSEDSCHHCGKTGLDYDYGMMRYDAAGNIEHTIRCPHCGRVWMDVFAFSRRFEIGNTAPNENVEIAVDALPDLGCDAGYPGMERCG